MFTSPHPNLCCSCLATASCGLAYVYSLTAPYKFCSLAADIKIYTVSALKSHLAYSIDAMLFRNYLASVIVSAALLFSSITAADDYHGPKNIEQFRHNYPYNRPAPDRRKKVYIKSSRNATDDVSADFYNGLKKANYGGTLVIPKDQTIVIGTKLDLTFLHDVEVQLEGEILVSRSQEWPISFGRLIL